MTWLKCILVAILVEAISCSPSFNTIWHEGRQAKLKLVQVVHRHGDRTPDADVMKNFPVFANDNNTFYPMGLGALVNKGKLRVYLLGTFLRRRYGAFLGNTLTPDVMDVRTTDYERTKASALMLMAGLWPPSESEDWADLMECDKLYSDECEQPDTTVSLARLWQPIPFYYSPVIEDSMLNGICKEFFDERDRVAASEDNMNRVQEFLPLMKFLSENTGANITKTTLLYMLYDTIVAEQAYGAVLPQWVPSVWDQLTKGCDFEFELLYGSIDNKKRAGGVLVDKLLSDALAKVQRTLKPQGRKLMEYSAHDLTVASVLAALGGEDHLLLEDGQPLARNQPLYGSAVIIEVYKYKGSYDGAIKILYYDQIHDQPIPLKISGCDVLCPLQKALALTSMTRISQTEFDKLCSDIIGFPNYSFYIKDDNSNN